MSVLFCFVLFASFCLFCGGFVLFCLVCLSVSSKMAACSEWSARGTRRQVPSPATRPSSLAVSHSLLRGEDRRHGVMSRNVLWSDVPELRRPHLILAVLSPVPTSPAPPAHALRAMPRKVFLSSSDGFWAPSARKLLDECFHAHFCWVFIRISLI